MREAEKGDQVVRIPVAYKPIVISRWHNNLADGSKYLEVQWKASWKWRKATIPRAQLHDAAKIVPALAGRGFPVNSNNRVEVVRYLADYETANVPAMPNEAISEQMGWVRDGVRRGFLAGDRLIAVGPGAPILFHPPGDGEAQLVKALKPTGDFETWRAAIAGLAPYPRVMVGVYASLATPLLELLCKPGFIVDWSHRTSTGKTVVLRAAASAWGNPDERSGYSLIQTWNTTMVGFERLAGALQSLPIILDDTKTAVRPQMVSDILYQAAVGHGKTRGAISGSRATAGWRTILLSTGERRAIDFTKDGGTAARCLPLWGPPFGRTSAEIAVQIRNLEEAIFSNYGHAGPRFVEWLLRQDVDELRERYAAVNTRVFDELRQGVNVAVASRMGYGVAVLEFAGLLVHEALELPWEYQSPWVKLLGGVTESLRDADRAKEAFSHVHAWAVERQELFWGRRTEKAYGDNPPSRWLGSWKGDELAFTTPALREALESAGYEMDPIVRQWAERRWLKRTSRHKRTSRATIGPSGDRPQCYVLRLRSRKRGSNA
ncbi:MAG: hypothetical protein AMJ46_12515 [Latescibacteria bacterium DG_63]|nr:MAG: hypothetical protein AMJ46_12515 [Latescibacteria bacterium DG_63]